MHTRTRPPHVNLQESGCGFFRFVSGLYTEVDGDNIFVNSTRICVKRVRWDFPPRYIYMYDTVTPTRL